MGPGCLLRDTKVGRGAAVTHAVCVSAEIGPGATAGPFTYLAPGSKLDGQESGQPETGGGGPRREGAQEA